MGSTGVPGDFDRCRVLIEEAVTKGGNKPLDPSVISGLCANLHKRNTGAVPGHAPAELAMKRAEAKK